MCVYLCGGLTIKLAQNKAINPSPVNLLRFVALRVLSSLVLADCVSPPSMAVICLVHSGTIGGAP